MITSGTGIFFDGNTSARREVAVELAPRLLSIRDAGGKMLAQWPYAEIEQVVSPEKVLRLAHAARDRWRGWKSTTRPSQRRLTKLRPASTAPARCSGA